MMKKLTKILTLSLASLALFACDDIVAKPSQVLDDNNLLTFGDDKAGRDNYDNDFEVIYDQLVSSGTSNSTILNALIKEIPNNNLFNGNSFLFNLNLPTKYAISVNSLFFSFFFFLLLPFNLFKYFLLIKK